MTCVLSEYHGDSADDVSSLPVLPSPSLCLPFNHHPPIPGWKTILISMMILVSNSTILMRMRIYYLRIRTKTQQAMLGQSRHRSVLLDPQLYYCVCEVWVSRHMLTRRQISKPRAGSQSVHALRDLVVVGSSTAQRQDPSHSRKHSSDNEIDTQHSSANPSRASSPRLPIARVPMCSHCTERDLDCMKMPGSHRCTICIHARVKCHFPPTEDVTGKEEINKFISETRGLLVQVESDSEVNGDRTLWEGKETWWEEEVTTMVEGFERFLDVNPRLRL